MIFGNANCIFTTRLLVANIVASVSQSITQLSWWTVDVIHTGNSFTASIHVVRITIIRTRWTLTFSYVIISNAYCLRTTLDVFACRSTHEHSQFIVFDAGL